MYPEVAEAKELIAELCRLFYDQVCTELVKWAMFSASVYLITC